MKDRQSHVFADPVLHKRIVNFLYTCYATSGAPEEQIALEFWRVYIHFLQGQSVLEFPYTLVDKTYVTAKLQELLRGELVNLDMEHRQQETEQ